MSREVIELENEKKEIVYKYEKYINNLTARISKMEHKTINIDDSNILERYSNKLVDKLLKSSKTKNNKSNSKSKSKSKSKAKLIKKSSLNNNIFSKSNSVQKNSESSRESDKSYNFNNNNYSEIRDYSNKINKSEDDLNKINSLITNLERNISEMNFNYKLLVKKINVSICITFN